MCMKFRSVSKVFLYICPFLKVLFFWGGGRGNIHIHFWTKT